MKIERIEKAKYRVPGSRGKNYIVDVTANAGLGSCDCEDFKFRIAPKWRDGIRVAPCKHICMAVGYALWTKANGKAI